MNDRQYKPIENELPDKLLCFCDECKASTMDGICNSNAAKCLFKSFIMFQIPVTYSCYCPYIIR